MQAIGKPRAEKGRPWRVSEAESMAKPRKMPHLVNFDGETLVRTRDIYTFSARRRKALVALLESMPQLETDDHKTFPYKDERGRLLGFVSLDKGELRVESYSVERTDKISRDVVATAGDMLTFSRRMNHDELVADIPAERTPSYGPDDPIGGNGPTLRELLQNPETRAQLEAQMPPGFDLSQLVGSPSELFDHARDLEGEPSEGLSFTNIGLRLDLLDEPRGYWVLNVPEWMTLGDLHRVLCTVLGREPAQSYISALPDGVYDSNDKGQSHPDNVTLRRVFQNYDVAMYMWREPQWGFTLRRSRVFTSARAAVELVRTEIFPPGDCATPADYQKGLSAGSLRRTEPFESLERRLRPYARALGSRIGAFRSQGLSLPSLLVACLLERPERPLTPFQLRHRAVISDYQGEVSVSSVKRALKRAPFACDPSGMVTLDKGSPAYAKAVAALEKNRAPEGPRLVARRFNSQSMEVQNRPTDVVLVVDDGPGLVHACEVCYREDGYEPMVRAIQAASAKFPKARTVVLDDLYHLEDLVMELDLQVEWRLAVEEPWQAFRALEQRGVEGGYRYPSGISQTDLRGFCAAAQQFYLLCPWVELSDSEVFEIVGLTPKPLIASILGQGHEVYGLSLCEGYDNFQRVQAGDVHASWGFMDFIESTLSGSLRERLREAAIPLLDEETCPFAYGTRQPATAAQFRVLTEALNLICGRFDEHGRVQSGTTEAKDSQGRTVRVTFPVTPDEATRTPSSKVKLGRNDPCWCGSGKKYKKCHYDIDG